MIDLFKELKSHAEQVEVVRLRSEATTVSFDSNKLKSSQVEETSGTAVRVIRHGQLGFAASSDDSALEKLASNALESASYGDKISLNFAPASTSPKVVVYDPKVASLPVSALVDAGRQMIEMLTAIEPEARININLERRIQHFNLRTHAGAEVDFQSSPLSITVELLRAEGDDILALFDMSGVTFLEDDLLAPARSLVQKLERSKTLTSIRDADLPVLFSPSGALALLLPLNEGLNGKNVYKGISPMKEKVGEKLFDEKLTIVDDATLDGRFGSAPYDDEGMPHRRNVLIEKGELKGFVYDIKTAAQSGVESTGNGSRGLFNPPSPSTTNLVIEAGKTPLADMIAGIDEGLLVEDLLGIGQGNIISGAFSNPVSLAFKIEKGELVGRVKNVSIAGNSYDLLKDVAAVSRETQWVYSTLNLPHILLPHMHVVSKN